MGIFDRLTIESKFAKWKFPLKVFFFHLGCLLQSKSGLYSPTHDEGENFFPPWRQNHLVNWRENLGMEFFIQGNYLSLIHHMDQCLVQCMPMLYLNWLAHDKFTIVRDSGKATGLPLICIHDFISEYDVVIMILIHWTGYLWIDFEPLQNEIV